MKAVSEEQLRRLIDDLDAIKAVLRKNAPLFRQMMLPRHFRLTALLGGIAVVVIALIYHFLMLHHGGYGAIPVLQRRMLLGLIVVVWVVFGVVKNLRWARSVSRIDASIRFRMVLKEFFSWRVLHLYIPVLVLIIVLIVWFVRMGSLYYIIPTLSIGFGLIYNVIGGLTEIRLYLLTGYWFFLTGLVILFIPLSPPLALSLSIGVGFLLFALVPERGSE
jgi:hypothetical protein